MATLSFVWKNLRNMKNGFGAWLQKQLDDREWRQADLARASGLTTASIAQFINDQITPGKRGAEKIARALKVSPNLVFEKAGLLPPSNNADPWVEEQTYRLKKFTGPRRSLAESLLKNLEEQEIQAAQEDEAQRSLSPNPQAKPLVR
jgi:transcriptional regulator with XRE-family HTH domain